MTDTAVLFPSQGFETPGMGLARACESEGAAHLLDLASARLGLDVRELLARGGPALRRQDVLQPVTLAVSLGSVAGAFDVEPLPLAAGHSLGEVGALAFSGGIRVEDALDFAAARGRIMADAARDRPGGVAAIRGTEEEVAEHLAALPDLAVAARNTARSWSICGPFPALAALSRRVETTWVTRAGPWHHPSHRALGPAVREALRTIRFAPTDGRFLSAHAAGEPESLADVLVSQLSTPVDWLGVVRRLSERGVRRVVVAEPARHFAAMVREIEPGLEVVTAHFR